MQYFGNEKDIAKISTDLNSWGGNAYYVNFSRKSENFLFSYALKRNFIGDILTTMILL